MCVCTMNCLIFLAFPLHSLICSSKGFYFNARLLIKEVLQSARSLDDKLQAYLYQLRCKTEETRDYSHGFIDGVEILNLYGFGIPTTMSNIIKEELKLKVALRNRSYSSLAKLPVKDEPIFELFMTVQKYAQWSSNVNCVKVLSLKSIKHAIRSGMGRHFPTVIVYFAASVGVQGKVKNAQELGSVSISLCDKIPHDKEISASVRMKAHGNVLSQLQPFCNSVEPLLRCHEDLKLSGGVVDNVLGSMMYYFDSFFAAGLQLDSLLESKLLLTEKLCRSLGRPGFLANFQIYRQFVDNLRSKAENPAEFQGKAFQEEEAVNRMNSNGRKMMLRDSSSYRLQLAFVFWNENVMHQMLERLRDYPLSDQMVARLHNRLCFTGLAAFALCQRKVTTSFLKLGKDVSDHCVLCGWPGLVHISPGNDVILFQPLLYSSA